MDADEESWASYVNKPRKTLLVIDDTKHELDVFCESMHLLDFDVVRCLIEPGDTLDKVRTILRTQKIDGILSDWQMHEGCHGNNIAGLGQKMPPPIPVVIHTKAPRSSGDLDEIFTPFGVLGVLPKYRESQVADLFNAHFEQQAALGVPRGA